MGRQPLLLGVGEVLGHRAAEGAVLLDEDVGRPLAPAAWPLLPGVELLARLRGTAGHDDSTDVLLLEDAEGGVLEELRALDELGLEAQVGLVGAEPPHRLEVGHPLERRLHVDVDELPEGGGDGLAQLEHVVLVDEGHLDVELGELRLAVGAEVLVPVAPGDLVVALHARDHQQLLEQLGALGQGVPATRRAGGKSRAPSGVERVSVGVSISTKSRSSSTRRAAALTLERSRSA